VTATTDEELASKVQWLADREAIAELFTRFSGSADVQDWDALANCFSPDIVFDRSHPTWDGHTDEAWVGLEQVMEGCRADGSRHFLGHHMITNHRCVIDGDTARAVAYLHSVHVDDPARPTDHYAHGAWYLTELTRVDERWMFSYMKHVVVWWPEQLRPYGPMAEGQRTEVREFLGAIASPAARPLL
jgi:hypothetical protein